jgi:hypothetical protein
MVRLFAFQILAKHDSAGRAYSLAAAAPNAQAFFKADEAAVIVGLVGLLKGVLCGYRLFK